jgi:hypothetical protein
MTDGASKLRERLLELANEICFGHSGISNGTRNPQKVADTIERFVTQERHKAAAEMQIAAAEAAKLAVLKDFQNLCDYPEKETELGNAVAQAIRSLGPSEVQAAMEARDKQNLAAALALFAGQVAEHVPKTTGPFLRCSCGRYYDPDLDDGTGTEAGWWQQHILALVPNPNAIAEHDAALVAVRDNDWIKALGYQGEVLADGIENFDEVVDASPRVAELKAQIASAEAKAYRRCADAIDGAPPHKNAAIFRKWADQAEQQVGGPTKSPAPSKGIYGSAEAVLGKQQTEAKVTPALDISELRHCIDQFDDGWGFNIAMATDHLQRFLVEHDAAIRREVVKEADAQILEARVREAKHARQRKEWLERGYGVASDEEYIANLEAELQKQKAEMEKA